MQIENDFGYFGRQEILTDAEVITRENLIEVLNAALITHWSNATQINYLYQYRKGNQPILHRTKDVRPEICNKIVINRAEEIVAFKTGYLLGEPIQYVARGLHADLISDDVSLLNDFMLAVDKHTKDKELADWMHICGVGYRYTLPATATRQTDSPFSISILDPRRTFVVKRNTPDKKIMMGVTYVTDVNGIVHYTCYTEDIEAHIDFPGGEEYLDNPLGLIPIVEYPLNSVRMGAFEPVLPILDAINNAESNLLDGIEQFIQALMLFHNVDITPEDYDTFRQKGAIKFRDIDPQMKADIQYVVNQLSQSETQNTVDDLYEMVLTICGMPNRNGGSSTSDTGKAVRFRDGWTAAEARAADSEAMFKRSERMTLEVITTICNSLAGMHLTVRDIDTRFTRRNYENLTEKANVLLIMLQNSKIHPRLAFEHCGMFVDPDRAYEESMEYYEECLERGLINEGAEDNTGSDSDTGSNPPQGESGGSEDGTTPGRDNRTKAEA